MKKLIILFGILGYLGIGCNENKKEEAAPAVTTNEKVAADTTESCTAKGMGKFKTYSKDDAVQMSDDYRDLVFDNYHNLIQQINLDPAILRQLACNADSIKLICAGVDKNVTMVLEYGKDKDVHFYDMMEVFGDKVLCPPPPDCGIPFTGRSKTATDSMPDSLKLVCTEYDMSKYTAITQEVAETMAKQYIALIKNDYREVIEQVIFRDPNLLHALLCNVDDIKLIAAADNNKKTTMILEYGRDSKVNYYDLKEIFGTLTLCPQPPECGIPLPEKGKVRPKRPKQN